MSSTVVNLKYSGGYFDQKYTARKYEEWLTDRGATFTFMVEDAYVSVPHVVLLAPEDATAFKLRFGL